MSKFGDKLKNIFTVDYDDDYEDDFYDDFDSDEVEKPIKKRKERTVVKEEPVSEPTPKVTRVNSAASARSTRPARSSKVVPMRGTNMEVCVIKPTKFESSKEVVDVLLEGKAVILNLEGIKTDIAQRIVDLVFGGCYAIDGRIQKISGYIYLVTPHSVDISGDFQELANGETPELNSSYTRRNF